MYYDWFVLVEPLSLTDKGRFFEAIYKHSCNGYDGKDLPEPVKSLFLFVSRQLDRDKEKYIKKCEKNEENIRKRYEKREKEKKSGVSYDLAAFEKSLNEY